MTPFARWRLRGERWYARVKALIETHPRFAVTVLAGGVLALISLGAGLLGGPPVRPDPAQPSAIPSPGDLPAGERRGPFRVLAVEDGETVRVEEAPGNSTTVRLLGVDAPVLSDRGLQTNCLAAAATATLASVLDGRSVSIEGDPSQPATDEAGRRLNYVFVENTLVNQIILQGGYATEYAEQRPYRYEARFRGAEQAARDDELGVWSPGRCSALRR